MQTSSQSRQLRKLAKQQQQVTTVQHQEAKRVVGIISSRGYNTKTLAIREATCKTHPILGKLPTVVRMHCPFRGCCTKVGGWKVVHWLEAHFLREHKLSLEQAQKAAKQVRIAAFLHNYIILKGVLL